MPLPNEALTGWVIVHLPSLNTPFVLPKIPVAQHRTHTLQVDDVRVIPSHHLLLARESFSMLGRDIIMDNGLLKTFRIHTTTYHRDAFEDKIVMLLGKVAKNFPVAKIIFIREFGKKASFKLGSLRGAGVNNLVLLKTF